MEEVAERVYGPWSFRAWGYGQPCIVEGCETTDRRPGGLNVIEQWHVSRRDGGMGRKGSWRETVFGCWRHHDESHRGQETFEDTHRGKLRVYVLFEPIHVGTLREAANVTQEAYRLWEAGLSR